MDGMSLLRGVLLRGVQERVVSVRVLRRAEQVGGVSRHRPGRADGRGVGGAGSIPYSLRELNVERVIFERHYEYLITFFYEGLKPGASQAHGSPEFKPAPPHHSVGSLAHMKFKAFKRRRKKT